MACCNHEFRRQLAKLKSDNGKHAQVVVSVYASPNELHAVCGIDADWREYLQRHETFIRIAAEMCVNVVRAPILPHEYFVWLGGRQNTPKARAEYAQTVRPPYRLALKIGYGSDMGQSGMAIGWTILDMRYPGGMR